ncbi:MAG: hypothetical protein AAFQ01_01940 [Bacteroidota bacterium]
MAYTYRQVLSVMNSGKPFSCTFLTLDRKRKIGGEVRTIEARVILAEELLGRPPTEQENREYVKRQGTRHSRNVNLLVDGHPVDQIRRIHIPLILEFNGEEVNP